MKSVKERFKVGSVVYLKSDLLKKCPMTVAEIMDDGRILVQWLDSGKRRQAWRFPEDALVE